MHVGEPSAVGRTSRGAHQLEHVEHVIDGQKQKGRGKKNEQMGSDPAREPEPGLS